MWWFKKKKVMTLTVRERLVCNKVERHLIEHYLEPLHDPKIPVHQNTIAEKLGVGIATEFMLIMDRTKHPGLEFLWSSSRESKLWFVRLDVI